MDQASEHGCNGVQILPQRDLYDTTTSAFNPNLENIRAIENCILSAHRRSMFVHIFMWSDRDRQWLPQGGLNSVYDKRLNRYIAARLGPLPGWTLSLGPDPFEWVDSSDVHVWEAYLKEHLG